MAVVMACLWAWKMFNLDYCCGILPVFIKRYESIVREENSA